jgi:hypothetical protein
MEKDEVEYYILKFAEIFRQRKNNEIAKLIYNKKLADAWTNIPNQLKLAYSANYIGNEAAGQKEYFKHNDYFINNYLNFIKNILLADRLGS